MKKLIFMLNKLVQRYPRSYSVSQVIPLWLHHALICEILLIQSCSSSYLSQQREVAKVNCEAKHSMEINSTISIGGKTPQIPTATSQKSNPINSAMRSATLIGWSQADTTTQWLNVLFFRGLCRHSQRQDSTESVAMAPANCFACPASSVSPDSPFRDSVRGPLA